MANFDRKYNSWLFAGMLLVCFSVSAAVRYQQFETWEKTPAAYFVGERPIMTTLDAPYWLRLAREYNEGTFGQKGGLRVYPESTETFHNMFLKESNIPKKFIDLSPTFSTPLPSSSATTEISYKDVPLLSFLIALISPFFNNNYYLTGTLLIPMFASLFLLPLGIYFFSIGFPLSGLLGGLIGTFAGGYYMRSSIGRIDTDMLNLFFPLLAGLLILLAGKAKTKQNVLLYALVAGLSLFLFQWWYHKEGFTLAFFMVLVFSLFIQQIRFHVILLSALLFVLCAQPSTFMGGTNAVQGFLKGYFTVEEARVMVIDKDTNTVSFPNTSTTISEVDHVPMKEVLRRVLSDTTLDWLGFLGFFWMAVFKWRVLLPLSPMLALGLLSFQSSNRFIMYLAPFIGIGLGWLIQFGIEVIFLVIKNNFHHREVKEGTKREGLLWAKIISLFSMDLDKIGLADKLKEGTEPLKHKGTELKESTKALWQKGTDGSDFDWWNWIRQGVLYLGMGVFFWLISGQTAISFVPGPSIHPRVYATFFEVKKRVMKDSALLTWWDYGYAITDATDLATFHDGGGQHSPKTYFISRGLISHEQDELYDITQFLSTEGNRGIAENISSPDTMLQAVRNPQFKPWDPIYLFFTVDMTGKYGAISKLGSWDIVNGGSKPRGYQNLACNKISNEEMDCRGAKIDLKDGFINNKLALRRVIFIRNGQVLRQKEFGHAQGYTLQLLVVGQQIVEVQFIDEEVFRSNYNQMFLLGRYREDLFEETYNAFPFSRLYKVKF